MIKAPKPSPALAAFVASSLIGKAFAAAFILAGLWALLSGQKGPALALALFALGANMARPGPSPELDRESGRH